MADILSQGKMCTYIKPVIFDGIGMDFGGRISDLIGILSQLLFLDVVSKI
jgi:hypothetical protein